MINKVILLGNLGSDPDIRSMQNGSKVANFSIATSESWKDKVTGERKDSTEWHRVVVYNDKLIEIIEKWIKKGAKLFIEGSLRTRKYTDASGVEKYSTEVVIQNYSGTIKIIDSKKDGSSHAEDFHQSDDNSSHSASTNVDDEIPF
jgi:single-strand DNA-binding protein